MIDPAVVKKGVHYSVISSEYYEHSEVFNALDLKCSDFGCSIEFKRSTDYQDVQAEDHVLLGGHYCPPMF